MIFIDNSWGDENNPFAVIIRLSRFAFLFYRNDFYYSIINKTGDIRWFTTRFTISFSYDFMFDYN